MLALGVLVLIIGGTDVPLTADSLGIHESVSRVTGAQADGHSGDRADPQTSTGESSGPFSSLGACLPVCPATRSPDSVAPRPFNITAPLDTPRTRRRAVELSDWYGRRLTLHRYIAYATIPVFALQWAAGDQLYKKSADAPDWAKTMHRAGATSLAAMFTVNTVTGAWNWWDTRSQSQNRVLRTVHALTMLSADAAFTYAGAKLSNDAETSATKRREHRTVALSAMGVTIVSGVAMKLLNR